MENTPRFTWIDLHSVTWSTFKRCYSKKKKDEPSGCPIHRTCRDQLEIRIYRVRSRVAERLNLYNTNEETKLYFLLLWPIAIRVCEIAYSDWVGSTGIACVDYPCRCALLSGYATRLLPVIGKEPLRKQPWFPKRQTSITEKKLGRRRRKKKNFSSRASRRVRLEISRVRVVIQWTLVDRSRTLSFSTGDSRQRAS